jgi:hypothetical protein
MSKIQKISVLVGGVLLSGAFIALAPFAASAQNYFWPQQNMQNYNYSGNYSYGYSNDQYFRPSNWNTGSNLYYAPERTYSYPTPQCTLSITTPNTYNGGEVTGTLSWTSTNASSAYVQGVGQVNPWSSISVYAYPGEVFTMTVTNPGGTSTCQTAYQTYQQQYAYPSYPTTYPTYNNYPTAYPTTYESSYQYQYGEGSGTTYYLNSTTLRPITNS